MAERCFCACHEYAGTYRGEPCNYCGHFNSRGHFPGTVRDGWQAGLDPRDAPPPEHRNPAPETPMRDSAVGVSPPPPPAPPGLREAAWRIHGFARHADGCTTRATWSERACDCGLRDARVALRAALASPAREERGEIPCTYACERCGRRDGLDVSLSDEDWARISGRLDGGGLLCLWCIDRIAHGMGIEVRASLHFAGLACNRDDPVDRSRGGVLSDCGHAAALEAIAKVLGPILPNCGCHGCEAEMGEALDIALAALRHAREGEKS